MSSTTLEGGAENQDGYTEVGSVSEDENETLLTFDDLLPQVRILNLHGVSASLNQTVQNGKIGTISMRIIHDFKVRAYLLRKDEDGVTTFKVTTGHGVL